MRACIFSVFEGLITYSGKFGETIDWEKLEFCGGDGDGDGTRFAEMKFAD